MLLLAFAHYRLFRFRDGVLAATLELNPSGWLNRLRYLWLPLLVGLPLLLAVLATVGYLFAAYDLRSRFTISTWLLVAAALVTGLADRWVVYRERKIALQRALEDRQVKPQEASRITGEEGPTLVIEEEELNVETLKKQNQNLFHFVIAATLFYGLWQIWQSTLPLLSNFHQIMLIGSFSLSDLITSIVIVVVTTVAVRNIQGLLEVALLQNLPLDNGTRYAIVTLSQYVLIAIGIVVAAHTLAFDMTQLAWIFAALSVGLGFGLQEVVANFVCGLILKKPAGCYSRLPNHTRM